MKKLFIAICITMLGIASVNADIKTEMPKARGAINVKGWQPFTPVATNPIAPRLAIQQASDAYLPIPEINGNVLYPPSSPHYLTMSRLPGAAGESFTTLTPSGLTANGGGVLVNGVYYCGVILSGEGYEEYFLFSFDGNTWVQLSYETAELEMMATDVALDPTDNKVYGCFYGADGSTPEFGCVDYANKSRTTISVLTRSWSGCAINAQGELFAIDIDGQLVKADKTTGSITTIGSTGLDPAYLSSACIDPHSGRMFYSYCPADDTGYLYEIDTATAAATMLYRFPSDEEIVGMYVCPPKAEYGAPGAVTGLLTEFVDGQLSGQVAFTAPTKNYDGETATGTLTYSISANGTEVATGNTEYGALVTADVTLPADNLYTIAVTVANATGSSPAAEVEIYAGHDTPTAPTVTASNNNGIVTVSWEPVTTGTHNGYIDTAAITYTVTRQTDNTTVASGIAATSVTDTFGEPEQMIRVSYAVTASANGHVSHPGLSKTVSVGPAVPPFREEFQEAENFEAFTVINANGDNREWYQFWGTDNNGRARIGYNSTKAMDDWLITPALRLEAGKIYILHVDCAKEGGAVNTERIEVKFGKDKTAEAMTGTIIAPTEVTSNDLTTFSGRIEPQESGIYYVGFHGCSDKDKFWLNLDNIDIEAGAIAEAPNTVTNLEVVPGSYGRHQAEIAFNVPTTDFNGNAVTNLTKVEIKRDGELIFTIDQPNPGQLILRTDATPEAGTHTYSVAAWNAAGEGKPAYATVYIGTKAPAMPKNLTAKETDNHGEVTLTWQSPDQDIDGNNINPDAVSYDIIKIINGEQTLAASGVRGLTYSCTAVNPTDHQFVVFAIRAVTEGGTSELLPSEIIPVGVPYQLAYTESFANGQPESIFASLTEMGNGRWGMLNDSSIAGVTSSDNDNGFAAMSGSAYNDRASLISGKINLRSAVTPQLSVKAFNMTGSTANTNPLDIYVNDGNGYSSIVSTTLAETGAANTWNTVTADLSAYNGKEIWLKFSGKIDEYSYILLDELKVTDTSSSISSAETQTQVKITTLPGLISINGATGQEMAICTADGQTVYYSGNASDSIEVPCVSGIYIVKTNESVSKVVVR